MKIDLPMSYKVEHGFDTVFFVCCTPPDGSEKLLELFKSQPWVSRAQFLGQDDCDNDFTVYRSPACTASNDEIIAALSQLCEYALNGYEDLNNFASWDDLTTLPKENLHED